MSRNGARAEIGVAEAKMSRNGCSCRDRGRARRYETSLPIDGARDARAGSAAPEQRNIEVAEGDQTITDVP